MRTLAHIATAASLAALAAPACAAGVMDTLVQVEEGVNFVGGVAGRVPEYWGGRESATGLAPMARWQLQGERFVQLLGTEVSANVLDHPNWRFGPSLGVRFGRNKVSDPIVNQMEKVGNAAELGVFLGYTEKLSADPRHRWGFNMTAATSAGRTYGGLSGTASVNYLQPVATWLTLSANIGAGFGSASFHNAYFGVHGADVALFPSLNGSQYSAGHGLTDVRMVVGGLIHLSPAWHVVVGARVQRLVGDAADSPIVRERGRATQWISGAGLVYLWR